MTFNVTELHILSASLGSTTCPAACAIRERFPDKNISVCHHSIMIDNDLYKTPDNLKEFIYRYDTNYILYRDSNLLAQFVQPITFELDEENPL
jgi:hypothetical protein